MATSKAPVRPLTRLYLAVPDHCDPSHFTAVSDVLADSHVAAVLLRLPAIDPRSQIERIKAFAPLVQPSGAALVIDGHADLVARGGADGAHLTGLTEVREALSSLRPQRIAGAGGLSTRHDAMLAGESGVDYVLFGEPDAQGARPASDAVTERIGWWAEVFEVACAAYAGSLEHAAQLAAAGADFAMIEACIWNDPRGAAAAVMDAAKAIRQSSARTTASESR